MTSLLSCDIIPKFFKRLYMKKEIFIFIGLFLFLSVGMHFKQWTSHPITHIEHLPTSQFGLFHPLYITFGVYVIVFAIRKVFGFILKLFRKKD